MIFYVAIFRPNNFDHAREITEEVMADIDRLNDEMVAAGIRIFVGGLQSCGLAKFIKRGADNSVTVTDGPVLESTNFVDGFWVLELPTIKDAVDWGKKAAAACRGTVEVRPFH